VLGGAIEVGLGFGLKMPPTTSRLRDLAERSLRIGDMVKVDNFEGRTDIRTPYDDPLTGRGRSCPTS
jgi:small-conductance mechanosensitive channel